MKRMLFITLGLLLMTASLQAIEEQPFGPDFPQLDGDAFDDLIIL